MHTKLHVKNQDLKNGRLGVRGGRGGHTGGCDTRIEGNHLLLIEEVVNVLVENHLADRL